MSKKFDRGLNEGLLAGISIGHYEAYEAVVAAVAAGTLDTWLEAERPKTMEEWDEWEQAREKDEL